MAEVNKTFSLLARNRAESLRWLADRSPKGRTLTREELFVMAREADQFAAEFSRLAEVEAYTARSPASEGAGATDGPTATHPPVPSPAISPDVSEREQTLGAGLDGPQGTSPSRSETSGSAPAKHPTLDDRNPSSVVGVPWNEDGYAGEESSPAKRPT